MLSAWMQNLLYTVGVKTMPAAIESDGTYTASSGHSLCETCGGSGNVTCDDCSGSGTHIVECDRGHEHEEDCNNCEGHGHVECFECEGTGEILDPDIELDEQL